MKKRIVTLGVCFGKVIMGFSKSSNKPKKTNILFCIMDDASSYMPAYGAN